MRSFTVTFVLCWYFLHYSDAYNESCYVSIGPNTEQLFQDAFVDVGCYRCFCQPQMLSCYRLDELKKQRLMHQCSSCWMSSQVGSCVNECWYEYAHAIVNGAYSYEACFECFCMQGIPAVCSLIDSLNCKNQQEECYTKFVDSKTDIDCRRCVDGLGLYYSGQKWSNDFAECECKNKTNFCYIKGWNDGYISFEKKTCDDCKDTITTLANLKTGCQFNGINILHGEERYLNTSGNSACLYCVCHSGDIKCLHHFNESSFVTCEGYENCTAFISNDDIAYSCSIPQRTICYNESKTWYQYGCLWRCSKATEVIDRPWCQSLVTDEECRKCPQDKERFIRENKDVIFVCLSGAVTWKYTVCDGYEDCVDGSDEINCNQHFCPSTIILFGKTEYLSPSNQSVGTSIFINCTDLSENSYDGEIEVQCKNISGKNKIEYDLCQCEKKGYALQLNRNLTIMLEEANRLLEDKFKSSKYVFDVKTRFLNFLNTTIFFENETSILIAVTTKFFSIRSERTCDTNQALDELLLKENQLADALNISFNIDGSAKGTFLGSFSKLYVSFEISDDMVQQIRAGLKEAEKIKFEKVFTDENSDVGSEIKAIETLLILDKVLTAASFSCLCIGVVLILFNRSKYTKTRLHLHTNMMTIYALALLVQLLPHVIDIKQYQKSCVVLVHLAYYTIYSTFTWMTSEGVNIMLILLFPLGEKKSLCFYYTIGYIVPGLILLILSLLSYPSFSDSQNCLRVAGSLSLIKWSAGAIITINIVILIICTSVFISKQKKSAELRKTPIELRRMLRSCMALLVLLGGTFFMGLFVDDSSIIYAYAHVTINGSLGIVMFIFHSADKDTIKSFICCRFLTGKFQKKRANTTIETISSGNQVNKL